MGCPIPPLLLSSPSLGTHADIPELDMAHACNSTDGVPKQKTLNVKANRGCMTKFCIKKFEEIHLKKNWKDPICMLLYFSFYFHSDIYTWHTNVYKIHTLGYEGWGLMLHRTGWCHRDYSEFYWLNNNLEIPATPSLFVSGSTLVLNTNSTSHSLWTRLYLTPLLTIELQSPSVP